MNAKKISLEIHIQFGEMLKQMQRATSNDLCLNRKPKCLLINKRLCKAHHLIDKLRCVLEDIMYDEHKEEIGNKTTTAVTVAATMDTRTKVDFLNVYYGDDGAGLQLINENLKK